MNKKNKLLTILLLAFVSFASCSSVETAEKNANNSANENISSNNKIVESEQTIEKTSATPKDKKSNELPKFEKGEAYKSVREKLIKAEWKPFTSPDADKCYGDDERCKDFPEMESCAGTGLGNCRYVWKKDGKTLLIFTVGDSPVYDGQDLQQDEKTASSDGSAGKYVYRYKHDSGYDEFIYELKEDGSATFKSLREGGDGRDLTGTWDESEGVVTMVFKNENGKNESTKFVLEMRDLKQLTDPEANENYKGFVGTVFKKQ